MGKPCSVLTLSQNQYRFVKICFTLILHDYLYVNDTNYYNIFQYFDTVGQVMRRAFCP